MHALSRETHLPIEPIIDFVFFSSAALALSERGSPSTYLELQNPPNLIASPYIFCHDGLLRSTHVKSSLSTTFGACHKLV